MTATPSFHSLSSSSKRASSILQRVKGSDTKPEVLLRSALWGCGHRYRLHAKDLPGKPDIVFRSKKVAVFVDGDFWHGRNWDVRRCKLAMGSNSSYWVAKIAANMARDIRTNRALGALGWTVVRLWETDIKQDVRAAVGQVEAALN